MEYLVTYFPVLEPGNVTENVTNETSLIIPDLEIYTEYNISVAASTAVGTGPSASVTERTDSSGECGVGTRSWSLMWLVLLCCELCVVYSLSQFQLPPLDWPTRTSPAHPSWSAGRRPVLSMAFLVIIISLTPGTRLVRWGVRLAQ